MANENDNELAHVGVMGMHWGRRKGSSDAGTSSGSKSLGKKILDNKVFKATIYNHDQAKKAVAEAKATYGKSKELGKKILDNKVFKAMVFDKDFTAFKRDVATSKAVLAKGKDLVGKVFNKKVGNAILANKVFKATIYNHDEAKKMVNDVKTFKKNLSKAGLVPALLGKSESFRIGKKKGQSDADFDAEYERETR